MGVFQPVYFHHIIRRYSTFAAFMVVPQAITRVPQSSLQFSIPSEADSVVERPLVKTLC